MNNNVLVAFLLTTVAGLSTGIGSTIALFTKKTNTKFLSISLGFSAGVMIYVSMIDIFPTAQVALIAELGTKSGSTATVLGFFGGIAIIALIDKLIPEDKNPHEVNLVENMHKNKDAKNEKHLMRAGVFTALAVGIHNFPEGLATFVAALHEPSLAIPIVVAIALHNIPEGIAVSVPIFYATGDRKKAFLYSFASGLAEPIGALIGYLILMPFMSETVFGVLFAATAGIMVYISIDELLPSAEKFGEHHLAIYGLIAGMGVMAISLLLFL